MTDLDTHIAALDHAPCLTADVAPVPGQLRAAPEDFEVEEVPAYPLSGQGEHLFVYIEKRGLNTKQAAEAIARAAGLDLRSAGWAGLKDKHAVTRQWLSFHTPEDPDPARLEIEGVRVLELGRHGNKLRTGHLRGNRFRLRLRNVPAADDARVQQVLQELQTRGLPNYFGAQRFGFQAQNLRRAHAWLLQGGAAPRGTFQRKLHVSALQAAWFDAWVAARLERNLFGTALAGDLMRKEETGGMFVSEDPAVDGPRLANWEITPTGPMFGAKMRWPTRDAAELEAEILDRWGLGKADLGRFRKWGEGSRRPLRVRPEGALARREGEDMWLEFTLPKGAYATVLVRELTKKGLLATEA